jgi:DNA-binding PadR family transcriptional regulator
MDPILKGTTFGAALEAAERDEQLKRDRRAAELGNVKPPAPLFYAAGRGYTTPVTTAQTVPSNDQLMAEKRAIWIQQAHEAQKIKRINDQNNAPSEIFQMIDTPKITTLRDLLELLSDDAWQKPPPGVDPALRKLAFANGLIEATGHTSARQWHITPEGVEELDRLRAGLPVVSDDAFRVLDGGINLDDPALHATPSETVDTLNQTIKRLQFELHIFHKVEAALKPMMDKDGQGHDLLTYVTWLRQQITERTQERDNETAIVDDINARAAADGRGYMDPRDYVDALRTFATNRAQESTAGIVADWYTAVIVPLIDFIITDNPQTTAEYLLSHPHMIANYVTEIMAPALRDMDSLADDRARTIDAHTAKIESLNRCIEALRENLQARMIAPLRAADIRLAGQILDELCEMIPEVEGYRVAREQAVKAIAALKERRS